MAGSDARTLSAPAAIALGTLAVGTLDALDAVVFFGLRGAAPGRIFQSIASGLLGRAVFDGGLATVALGVACHYTVALGIVATYFLVSRKLTRLAELAWPVVLNGLLIHMIGVGTPAALAAWACPPTRAPSSGT